LGFAFHYADDMRMHNTFRAHQLLHWAGQLGRKHDLEMILFEAFFSHRKNINDPDELAQIAAEISLDREEATAVLAKGKFADAVRDEENYWSSNGIGGVPAMILYQKQLVTGAQGIPNHVAILHYLAGNQAA
jgi:predicted DsbA family dithiol-disulfide isomerase